MPQQTANPQQGPLYETGPIRPPSEAKSLMVRVTRGCPWHKCEFCSPYRGTKYEVRPVDDVLADIDASQKDNVPYKTAFLQDADPLFVPTKDLIRILQAIHKAYPEMERITTYARAFSMYKKTPAELKELRAAGLSRIHRGLETGYAALLEYMKKGATPKMQIEGGQKIMVAGIELSDYVIPGLGGNLQLEDQPTWKRHAEETARVINEVNPDFVRLRTYTHQSNSPLMLKVEQGEFKRLTDQEIVSEIGLFVDLLEGPTTVTSDHQLNVLMEVQGKIPDNKEEIQAVIDQYLGMTLMQQHEFRLGKFMHIFHTLAEFEEFGEGEVLEDLTQRFLRNGL